MTGWKFWPDRPAGPVDDAYAQLSWMRPYRPGPWRIAAVFVVLLLLVFVVFEGLSLVLTDGRWPARVLIILVTLLVAAPLAWLAGRAATAGVWVNDHGVRVLGLRKTVVAPWSEVGGVSRQGGRVRLLGSPLRVDGEEVWLDLRHRSQVPTGLTSRSPDFLAKPEAYDIAAGAVERWWFETR